MERYTVWYDEVRTNKVWFQAESLEHAKELIRQLNNCEIVELPNASEKCKNVEITFGLDTLEQVKGDN
jgi:hypothetical protein